MKRVGWAGTVVDMLKKRNELRVLMGKPEVVCKVVSTILLGIKRLVQIYFLR
jgi:hypothetical protein